MCPIQKMFLSLIVPYIDRRNPFLSSWKSILSIIHWAVMEAHIMVYCMCAIRKGSWDSDQWNPWHMEFDLSGSSEVKSNGWFIKKAPILVCLQGRVRVREGIRGSAPPHSLATTFYIEQIRGNLGLNPLWSSGGWTIHGTPLDLFEEFPVWSPHSNILYMPLCNTNLDPNSYSS